MREIKFRGIGKADKKWIYGDLRIGGLYKANPAIIDHRLDDDDTDAEISLSPEVYPDTIGQYTGLKDRNGKDIYEGDLLQDDAITWEVFWCDDVAAFMVEQYQSESDAPKMFLLSEVAKDSTILGNIHDNP